ncbi:histidine phosphatase family protein [Ruicaihuangia caeni]|uniref:Histidine phosphatase family protein n=1 Tax=Ruicaihuangia caeni TaxID=3042517 RepID=A0AAW6TC29_9MICO|nr:histidine phosphatase family protein [Klugiella sp. YN-L-19]MDI2098910.1 histidine phosphatase family protein [Klugiella sp. YN-L-19]
MAARLVHLVRHGEVHNPQRILYGRIPGFHLSELGHRMAALAAEALDGHDITALYASPLQRAQESAAPWAEKFELPIQTDDRLIEPTNRFEGKTFEFGPQVLVRPQAWPWVVNPFRPSWGEPFTSIAARMIAAMNSALDETEDGEVVMVSHQSPIWLAHRAITGQRLWHDPRRRRCSLSSITTFERRGDRFAEVNYQDPARELLAASVDLGAV